MKTINSMPCYISLTIDFAIAFTRVPVLLENKNLMFWGTSRGNGYDSHPFATGTCNYQLKHEICYGNPNGNTKLSNT
jgi:hypothetical protein